MSDQLLDNFMPNLDDVLPNHSHNCLQIERKSREVVSLIALVLVGDLIVLMLVNCFTQLF